MTVDSALLAARATELLALLERGEVSPLDLLDTLEARVTAVEPSVHALPTLCFDRARQHAESLMAKPFKQRGRLAGIPVPIKDLDDVAGVRTTYGSPIFRNHIPASSSNLVEKLEAEGALVYAKSNTPEFGSGAHTFNEVFATTANPHNVAMSAGGSSGGAAAALASGTAWLAQGSDMAGSLRTPAGFCGVVGMRPSPGRVMNGPGDSNPFDVLSTAGPMARNVEDTALLLDAMSGRCATDPLAQAAPVESFRSAAQRATRPARVAVSGDLGITSVDPEIATIFAAAVDKLAAAGIELSESQPDLAAVHDTFSTLRAHNYALAMADTLRDHRELIKPDNVWNIEQGLALSAAQITAALRERGALFQRFSEFLQGVEVLVCPTAIVPSFPIEQRYVSECNGHQFDHYFEWLAIVYAATTVGLPAISIPCGRAANGVPVGMQIIGRAQGDEDLLSVAACFEAIFAFDTTPVAPATQ